MSLASSNHRQSTNGFDLDYSIHDFEVSPHRDNRFLCRRMEEELLRQGTRGGVALDVACGIGSLTQRLRLAGLKAYGLDPSGEMLGISVLIDPARRSQLVRGVAEALAFRGESFDLLVCEGALDHFVEPGLFMRQAAATLRPGGRLAVALANFESLSCRIGRLTAKVRKSRSPERPYWEPPHDHHHRGEMAFIRSLSDNLLRLERCYGVSMLWLLPGWGKLLDRLPRTIAEAVLSSLDRVARGNPGLADVIISVWVKD